MQRLVEISGLAGLDYLILCSMEESALGSQCLDTKLGIVQQCESRGRFSRVAPYASPFANFLKAVDSGPQPGLGCRREGGWGPLPR